MEAAACAGPPCQLLQQGWCWGFRLVGGRKSFTHPFKEMFCPCWALLPLVRPSTSTDTVVEAGGTKEPRNCAMEEP